MVIRISDKTQNYSKVTKLLVKPKVLSVEKNWYRIVDDSDDDYLYPPDLFEIIEE